MDITIRSFTIHSSMTHFTTIPIITDGILPDGVSASIGDGDIHTTDGEALGTGAVPGIGVHRTDGDMAVLVTDGDTQPILQFMEAEEVTIITDIVVQTEAQLAVQTPDVLAAQQAEDRLPR